MTKGFDWTTSAAHRPWEQIDGPSLAKAVGAIQLIDRNQGFALELQVLASIAVGLPQLPTATKVSSSMLRALLKRGELQDPDGTGVFEIADLFCSEINLVEVPFRFLAGSGGSSHLKAQALSQSILKETGANLPAAFLRPAMELIRAVAQISEAVCDRAGISRTRPPVIEQPRAVEVPSTERLRMLETAITFELADLPAQMLESLRPLANTAGTKFEVYPTETYEELAVRPFLLTDDQLIVVCPGELAGALCVELLRAAAAANCLGELAALMRPTSRRLFITG